MARSRKSKEEVQQELSEKQRFNAAKAKIREKNKKRIRVKFTNIESPGVDVPFNFQGDNYHLYDGETYNLPVHVVNHLNKLVFPRYEMQPDPDTGMIKSVQVGETNRFSVVPVDMGDLEE